MSKLGKQHVFLHGLLFVLLSPSLADAYEIDGLFNEVHWQNATEFDKFLVVQPKLFEPAPEATRGMVISDDTGLFIGFINQQSNQDTTPQITLFDQDIQSDFVEVIIDFSGRGRKAYGIKLSKENVIQDAIWSKENQQRIDWNGQWRHAIAQTTTGWNAEIFIPWSSFSMESIDSEMRDSRIYLARWHQGIRKKFAYPAIDASNILFLSEFAPIEISNVEYSSLNWLPYVSVQFDQVRDEIKEQAGISLFWQPSQDRQLNLTVNPDFTQVESDELIVNFSAIESFFEEKRPFFIENHAMFDLRGPENFMLVNTRRIGSTDEEIRDIDFAGRFTQLSEFYEYGFLAAKEQNNTFGNGKEFLSARWSLIDDSYSWGMLYNRTQDDAKHRIAQVLASDIVYEFNESWQFTGLVMRSDIESTKVVSGIKDKDQIGFGWTFSIANQIADHWYHELSLLKYGKALDVNDFGFSERVNLRQLSYDSVFEWPSGYAPWGISDSLLEIGMDLQRNDRMQLINEYDLTLAINTTQHQEFEFELEYQEAGVDDLLTFGHRPVKLPNGYGIKFSYKSDQRKRVIWDLSASFGQAGLSATWREFELEPSFQISEGVHLEMEITYLQQSSWLLSLFDEDESEEDYLFNETDVDDEELDDGEDDFEVEEMTHPSQHLVGHYKQEEISFAIIMAARWQDKHELRVKLEGVTVKAAGIEQLFVEPTGHLKVENNSLESFSESEFLLQFRYRYEISPLSSVYVVYGRGGEAEFEHDAHSRNRLVNDAINNRNEENIVVKATFRF